MILTTRLLRHDPVAEAAFLVNFPTFPPRQMPVGSSWFLVRSNSSNGANINLGRLPRAFSDQFGSCPELAKKFAHCSGGKSSMASAIAAQRSSTVRAAAFLSEALSLAKACSMGLKSGE